MANEEQLAILLQGVEAWNEKIRSEKDFWGKGVKSARGGYP